MTPPTRILLTGYMGSGKTTVGKLLADSLGWSFADLDQEIAQTEQRSVAEIFALFGESRFRDLEASTLRTLLDREQLVIALGGGAPGSAAVRELLEGVSTIRVVHLHAPFPVLFARCEAQKSDTAAAIRPLLGDRVTAETRYHQRYAIYAALAHHTAAADLATPQAVAESIAAALFPARKQ